MKLRQHKRNLYMRYKGKGLAFLRTAEEQAWLDLAPVGREFGSADFEKLTQFDAESDETRASGENWP